MANNEAVMKSRNRMGVFVVLIGVGGLVGALIVVIYQKPDSTGGTILGIIASPIAAIVASYFGISAAREASQEAGAARQDAGLMQLSLGEARSSLSEAHSTIQKAARTSEADPTAAGRIVREAAAQQQRPDSGPSAE